jgi:hypothetical protein
MKKGKRFAKKEKKVLGEFNFFPHRYIYIHGKNNEIN